jgi:hypothetical protein
LLSGGWQYSTRTARVIDSRECVESLGEIEENIIIRPFKNSAGSRRSSALICTVDGQLVVPHFFTSKQRFGS